jgi:hypothetical protein
MHTYESPHATIIEQNYIKEVTKVGVLVGFEWLLMAQL